MGTDEMDSLTSRERQIVQSLVPNGLSNKGIGRQLNISEGTVKVHLHNIFTKLGVRNRTALVAVTHAYSEELQQPIVSHSRADELDKARKWAA
jgi:two-component system nitrate/nitrite response regulator NarL